MSKQQLPSAEATQRSSTLQLQCNIDHDVEALLSPKSVSDEELFASPTAEGRLQAALTKISRLEDIDEQLRSQLEKMIGQRNQLSAEKAARDIEIQHLQAQVELLEADSAGRHNSDSRPGSPRESELDQHVESLQADNARLQMQVKSSGHEIIELQQQLQHSERQVLQQLPRKPQDPFLSPDTSVVSQLQAQISKSEYEVARQAAQILELQGELTKVQVIYDRSAQRQTETSAQLTRQESTASRHAANNLQLQEQVAEAQITAASQDNRISQLQAELVDSNSSLVEAQQQSSQLKEELTQAQGLSAQLQSASSKLKMHSDEQSAAAASQAAAEADLRAKLEAQQAAQSASENKFEQELKSLHKLAAAAQKQEDSLHSEVQVLQGKTDEQQKSLAGKETHIQLLTSKLEAETASKAALEQQLHEAQNQQQQAPIVDSLNAQLTQTQAQVTQLESDIAHAEQNAAAQEALAAEVALTVSELKTQLGEAHFETAAMAKAHKQLQQQLGERTIVLGQKAHQITNLTAQLNDVQGLSPDDTRHDSAKRAGQPNTVGKPLYGVSSAGDFPITPFQAELDHPPRPLYTPSDSESKSLLDFTPDMAPAVTVTKLAGKEDTSRQDATPTILEAQFDDDDSSLLASGSQPQLQQQQPQLCPAVCVPGMSEAQLSPPQSRPSSPRLQPEEGNGHDSTYPPFTHVNGCFDRSDEEEQGVGSIGLLHDGVSHVDAATEEGFASGLSANGSGGSGRQSNGRSTQRLEQDVSVLKEQLDRQSQGNADADANEAEKLLSQLSGSQRALKAVTLRAESAEKDLKAALIALGEAEEHLARSVYRQEAAEVVGLVSGCVAAFLAAAGMTVYLLH